MKRSDLFSLAIKYYWKMWDSLENIPFLQKELLFQKWKSKNGEKLVVDSISKENFRSFKEILYSSTARVNKTKFNENNNIIESLVNKM